ncbi:MFS transporter [Peribacillus cavernae]|uniref:MFS transporter n=1 Tax=Peribacillus cavernae TaxID=1674310 RepID=A0A3S0VR46_9BACI|nr:MFS transporter [Peribacillus cavernae]MDQ0218785.1 DHA1 family multidrug resistance protein B-like MFS transporter [Peribacillus cavernae]RUQ30995.1 MFS transporter [Peribacillus cavernae]
MRFKDFHKNIKIRIIETFLSRFVSGMIFPFMTIYLVSHFGAKAAGLLLLINVFAGISVSFLGGYFSDQFGRKKIMLSAEILRFLAFFTMMLCNSPWFESALITFLMMTVNSICWGLAGPANEAMLIDVSTPNQRKLMYSITYWANNFSIAIGGIAGAFLFKDHLFELFIALSFVAAIIVILVGFFMDESHVPASLDIKPTQHIIQLFSSYKIVLRDRLFIWFVVAGVLILSMEMQLTNYVGIRLASEMHTQHFLSWEIDGITMLGFLRSENTILVVFLALFATRLTDYFKDRTVLLASCLLFSIGYGVLSYANNIWVLFVFMVLLTIGEVFRVPVEQSYITSIPPDHARSAYMAINGLKYNLSMLIASLTVTVGSFLSSLTMAILITVVGLTGTFIYLLITPTLDRRKHERHMEQVS